MATRRPRKAVKQNLFTHLAHLSLPSFEESIDTSMAGLNLLDHELASEVKELLMKFAREFSRIAVSLHRVDQIIQFESACRERFEDLTRINAVILTDLSLADEFEVLRTTKRGDIPFKWKYENNLSVFAQFGDQIENIWIQGHKRPGCYKYLLLANLLIIAWLAQADEMFRDLLLPQAGMLSTLILSVGRLYEDMRPNDAYIDVMEDESLSRLEETHSLDKESEWYSILLGVLDDITSGSQKRYVRDIVNAIARSDLKSSFTFEDYHVSFRKTGTAFEGQGLPGLYASLVEEDEVHPIDEVIGYTSAYNPKGATKKGLEQLGAKTVTIEQHKLSRRTIKLGDNPRQDRLNWGHLRAQRFLDRLRCDCTRNQTAGVDQAKVWTSREYRDRVLNSVYSLDISKATDTVNQEFQSLCLGTLFPPEYCRYWDEINSSPQVFRFRRGSRKPDVTYRQLRGQSQGYKLSFPAFAYGHHVLMRMVMRKCRMEGVDPTTFYRVLGDDSIISTPGPDPDGRIMEEYVSACNFIGWTVNRDKGFVSRTGDPFAFAEFAKKRVLNGRVITPIPSKLLLNGGEGLNGPLSLLMWISGNLNRISIRKAIESTPCLKWVFTEEEVQALSEIVSMGFIPGFKDFEPDEGLEVSEVQKLSALLAYFVPKLEATLVDCLLPDELRDVATYKPWSIPKTFLMGTRIEEKLFDLAQDSKNKYFLVLQYNSDIIDAVKEIVTTGLKPASAAVVSLRLTPEEEETIFRSLGIFDLIRLGELPTSMEEACSSLAQALQILEGYNPRSDSRTAYLQSCFASTLTQRYLWYSDLLQNRKCVNEASLVLEELAGEPDSVVVQPTAG